MKRKGRESAGTTLFKEMMREQKDTQKRVLQLLESDVTANQVTSNVSSVISVITRMVNQGMMQKYVDLWCFGMNVLENVVKRDFFLNFPEDDGRLAWLQDGDLEQRIPPYRVSFSCWDDVDKLTFLCCVRWVDSGIFNQIRAYEFAKVCGCGCFWWLGVLRLYISILFHIGIHEGGNGWVA
ncbi:hypothetical protein OROGR_018154 [Orobanche gracilis]